MINTTGMTISTLVLPSKSTHGYNSIRLEIVLPREELDNVNASNTKFLFGLFAEDEMSYRWDMAVNAIYPRLSF